MIITNNTLIKIIDDDIIDGDCVIPNEVAFINGGMFLNADELVSITLPPELSCIEDKTFYKCRRLIKVAFPEQLNSIGNWAFASCYQLVNLNLPKTLKSIGEMAFAYCGIKHIILPAGLNYLGKGAFSGCADLTCINLPNELSTIEHGTFNNCTRLTRISLPAGIIKIAENAFNGCRNLKTIIIHGDSDEEIERIKALLPVNLQPLVIATAIQHIQRTVIFPIAQKITNNTLKFTKLPSNILFLIGSYANLYSNDSDYISALNKINETDLPHLVDDEYDEQRLQEYQATLARP